MNTSTAEKIGKYSTAQSVSEIGLGSVVHSLKIPLGGHALSLNQGLLLVLATKSCAARLEAARVAIGVSLIASALKSLSPSGKKVMPMLAISMQGLLFSAGVASLGLNFLGVTVGLLLLSFWGFAQPLLMAYLIFGETLFQAIEKLWTETAGKIGMSSDWGIGILLGVVAVKFTLSVILAYIAWRPGQAFEERYFARMEMLWERARTVIPKRKVGVSASGHPWVTALRGAAVDLLNPLFLVSFVLSVGFLVLTNVSESDAWIFVLRTLLGGYLFFFLIRVMPVSWFGRLVARNPALGHALKEVSRRESGEVPPRH